MEAFKSQASRVLTVCACFGMSGIFVVLAGCGPSLQTLDSLARSGRIDPVAPVIVHAEIRIEAPTSKIWTLLVNVPAWPHWDKDLTDVSAKQPLAPGQYFTWGAGSSTIRSQVQLFEPEHRIAWTGTAYTARAVHLWTIMPEPDGSNRVTIDESMDGPMMATLFSSRKLAEVDDAWLAALKKAAEQ